MECSSLQHARILPTTLSSIRLCFSYTKCGCIDLYEWPTRNLVVPGTDRIVTAPVCSKDNLCYKQEINRITNDYAVWLTNCPMCVQECETTDFRTQFSSLSAPLQWLLDDLKPRVESLSVPLPINWSNTWESEISRNYLALEIVSENTGLELYNDTPLIGPVDLLSSVGGHTGLWIGISFLSLMELAEMLYRLIRCQFYKLCTRKSPASIDAMSNWNLFPES